MIDYDFIEDIENSEILNKHSYEYSFQLAADCAKLLSSNDAEQIAYARRVVIHVLDHWQQMPAETYPIWADIIEAVGFYPYIEKNKDTIAMQAFADAVRQKGFLSENLHNVYMHSEQRKLADYLLSGKNIVASAPTSFGKSLLIEEVVASLKYKNIVIIQPTLALLDETRLKLKRYSDRYKIIVRTTQPASSDKGNLFLLTAERVLEYEGFPNIDFLVIDEFYKLSLRRKDDRASALNNAFLKILNQYRAKFYFLGPNIDDITPGFASRYDALFYKSNYSLVDCNVIDLSTRFNQQLRSRALDAEKLPVLFSLLDSLEDEQTLIYCSSPARARRFARKYWLHLGECETSKKYTLPLVEWIEKNVSSDWSLVKSLRFGVAVHDGSLQKHIGASIIKYFNEGNMRCIFCTSTIIEGVNTSAKNVIIFDGDKGDKSIDFFDYSNIKGRSGRLMEHYVGKIISLTTIPQKESIIIDIPFYEQDKETLTDEILVNIEPEDVKPQVTDQYNKLNSIEPDLLKIIKRNGIDINSQLNIFYALERDVLTDQYPNIAWSQNPSKMKLEYILSLAENNTFNFNDKHGVFSVKQLVYFIDLYRQNKSINHLANKIYKEQCGAAKTCLDADRKQAYLDNAIEIAFHVYRHWFQYSVPKALRVIDSIQRYVCEKHGRAAGSYSYFAQQLENDFVRENLSILVEYGIPSDTVRKLARGIPEGLDEDEVIEFIKANRNTIYNELLQYEQERLEACL